MVAMRRRQKAQSLAAITRTKGTRIEHVNCVHGLRISEDMGEVPGPLRDALVVIDASPGISAIVGAVKPSVLSFDQRIHPVGVGTGDRNRDPSEDSGGEAFPFKPLPGGAG